MKKKPCFKYFSVVVLAILIFSSNSVEAGAWPQKKGKGYFKLDFRYLAGKKIYESNGEKISIPDFKDFTIGAFGSYGITDDFTAFLNLSVFKSTSLDLPSNTAGFDTKVSGFGDVDLGIKYGILRFGQSIVSTSIILGIPTGKSYLDGSLWLGDGEFNQAVAVEMGHSFWPSPVYVTGGISFNNRSKGFSDEFAYRIESGYNFTKDLTLIVRLHGKLSLKNGDESIRGGFGIYSNNQQYIAYNAELVYKIVSAWGVKAYYESGTKGKNIISAPVINAGIFYLL